jgi:hypothetical protein
MHSRLVTCSTMLIEVRSPRCTVISLQEGGWTAEERGMFAELARPANTFDEVLTLTVKGASGCRAFVKCP